MPDITTLVTTDGHLLKRSGTTIVGVDPAVIVSVDVTTSAYTLALSDAGKVVRFTFVGASTLTVPTNATVAFPVGTIVKAYAFGGGLTIAAATGVTIRNNGTAVAQYGEVTLRKDSTDEWVRVG